MANMLFHIFNSAKAGPSSTTVTAISLPSKARTTSWYRMKAQLDDEERAKKGEVPKRRNQKRKEYYACGRCGKHKTKDTNHSQYKGRWYCPHEKNAVPYEEWKASMMAEIAKKKA